MTELEVRSTQRQSYGIRYGVTLEKSTIRKLGVDTVISKNVITWKEISRPMVPRDYQSKQHINSHPVNWFEEKGKKEKKRDAKITFG